MCVSTVYANDEGSKVLAEYIAELSMKDDTIIMTDVMGVKTQVKGRLLSADLTRGVLIVQPE